jgi:hypothetical protein
MQTRRLNEALIGILALGKIAELGRQLVVATDKNFAEKLAKRSGGAKAENLQSWANGYIALDSIISVTGILGMIQGMRKNRKGAGQAARVQGGAIILYSIYYLLYSLVALDGAKGNQKLINVLGSLGHTIAGIAIYRFSLKALK